jgi:hypothetical protein
MKKNEKSVKNEKKVWILKKSIKIEKNENFIL